MHSTRSVALIVLVSFACGGPSVELDGGDRDGGGDSGPAVVPCESNRACDDDRYCNGEEACRPGDPLADARGCVAGAAPCMPSQTCDEVMARCVSDCAANPDADGDFYISEDCGGDDCDDSDRDVNPRATEVCDELGRDEDCNPNTLSGPTETDLDGDGYVDAACCNRQPSGALLCGLDCDDSTAAARPGYPETCDEIDNDCDGMVDERVRTTYYRDADGDLYGNAADSVQACAQPEGYVASMGDCDDSSASVHPTAPETCNGLDDDCDTMVDEEVAPAPATPDHCGGCGLACPIGYRCAGTMCEDRPVKLAAGAASTCALTEAGHVYCWGGNSQGEVGVGSTAPVIDRPMQVALPMRAVDVGIVSRAADLFTNSYQSVACAVLEDGTGRCWGSMVGPSPGASPWGPFPASTVEFTGLARTSTGTVYRIDAGWTLTGLGPAVAIDGACARRGDGTLACWTGSSEMVYPTAAGGSLQAGEVSFCATRADGQLLCWGRNGDCQVGPGSASIAAPQLVAGLPALELTSIATRSEHIFFGIGAPPQEVGHSCAALVDGRAYCWGANARGELGIGSASSTDVCTPTRVTTTERFEQIVTGSRHTCALSDVGEVWCWGANDGRLGTADTTDSHTPTRLFGFPARVAPPGP